MQLEKSSPFTAKSSPSHPGEGEPFGNAARSHRLVFGVKLAKVSPSPGGEGRDEGERIFSLNRSGRGRGLW